MIRAQIVRDTHVAIVWFSRFTSVVLLTDATRMPAMINHQRAIIIKIKLYSLKVSLIIVVRDTYVSHNVSKNE